MAIKTKGIILKKIDQAEADRIFTILTRDFGKLSLLGRGTRKINSKLRAGLSEFSLIYLEFVSGRTQKIITESTVINNFFDVKGDLKKLQAGFYICRLLDKFLRENERDDNIWNLAVSTLEELAREKSDLRFLQVLLRYFECNFIKFLGYMPEFYLCVICRGEIKEEINFLSLIDGGLVCQKCGHSQKAKLRYSGDRRNIAVYPETIKILRLFFTKDFDFTRRLKLKKENPEELKKISKSMLEHILEKECNLI